MIAHSCSPSFRAFGTRWFPPSDHFEIHLYSKLVILVSQKLTSYSNLVILVSQKVLSNRSKAKYSKLVILVSQKFLAARVGLIQSVGDFGISKVLSSKSKAYTVSAGP